MASPVEVLAYVAKAIPVSFNLDHEVRGGEDTKPWDAPMFDMGPREWAACVVLIAMSQLLSKTVLMVIFTPILIVIGAASVYNTFFYVPPALPPPRPASTESPTDRLQEVSACTGRSAFESAEMMLCVPSKAASEGGLILMLALPGELVSHVCSFFDFRTLCSAREISSCWLHALTADETFRYAWSNLYRTYYGKCVKDDRVPAVLPSTKGTEEEEESDVNIWLDRFKRSRLTQLYVEDRRHWCVR
jgi:hypothetical protein